MKRSLFLIFLGSCILSGSLCAMDRDSDSGSDSSSDSGSSVETENKLQGTLHLTTLPGTVCDVCGKKVQGKVYQISPCLHVYHLLCASKALAAVAKRGGSFVCPCCEKEGKKNLGCVHPEEEIAIIADYLKQAISKKEPIPRDIVDARRHLGIAVPKKKGWQARADVKWDAQLKQRLLPPLFVPASR